MHGPQGRVGEVGAVDAVSRRREGREEQWSEHDHRRRVFRRGRCRGAGLFPSAGQLHNPCARGERGRSRAHKGSARRAYCMDPRVWMRSCSTQDRRLSPRPPRPASRAGPGTRRLEDCRTRVSMDDGPSLILSKTSSAHLSSHDFPSRLQSVSVQSVRIQESAAGSAQSPALTQKKTTWEGAMMFRGAVGRSQVGSRVGVAL